MQIILTNNWLLHGSRLYPKSSFQIFTFMSFLPSKLYTFKTKTRKKNTFRSSTVMVLKMSCFWNQKCSFFRDKSRFGLEKVTVWNLFRYWIWIWTKKRTLFLRVYTAFDLPDLENVSFATVKCNFSSSTLKFKH
jgi:hypothetical protein